MNIPFKLGAIFLLCSSAWAGPHPDPLVKRVLFEDRLELHHFGAKQKAQIYPVMLEALKPEFESRYGRCAGDESCKAGAAWALLMIDEPAALPALVEAFKKSAARDRSLENWAIGFFEKHGDPTVVEPMIEALGRKPEDFRIVNALRLATGENFGKDTSKWREFWKSHEKDVIKLHEEEREKGKLIAASLKGLFSPDREARLRTANEIIKLGPVDPYAFECQELFESEDQLSKMDRLRCRYHNHAIYHAIRITSHFAKLVATPGTRENKRGFTNAAAHTLARIAFGDSGQGFALATFDGLLSAAERGDVGTEALRAYARRQFIDALSVPDGLSEERLKEYHPRTAEAAGTRWYVVTRNTGIGMGGGHSIFTHQLIGSKGNVRYVASADAYPDVAALSFVKGAPLRGVLESTSGFGGDDNPKFYLYDLEPRIAHVCTVEYANASKVNGKFAEEPMRYVKAEGKSCTVLPEGQKLGITLYRGD